MDAFLNGVYLEIIEACQRKWIFNSNVDDAAAIGHYDKLLAHVC